MYIYLIRMSLIASQRKRNESSKRLASSRLPLILKFTLFVGKSTNTLIYTSRYTLSRSNLRTQLYSPQRFYCQTQKRRENVFVA